MKRILIFLASALIVVSVSAQEKIHQASSFGIKSDGVTLNTRSIQAAIDYIGSHGGGVLEISVGRYLTGSIHLKSTVELRLLEGAVLVGNIAVRSRVSPQPIVGYENGAKIAKKAHAENISLKEAAVALGLFTPEAFDAAFHPEKMI